MYAHSFLNMCDAWCDIQLYEGRDYVYAKILVSSMIWMVQCVERIIIEGHHANEIM